MKKIIYMTSIMIAFIIVIGFALYIFFPNEDNGKRTSIEGTSIDWRVFLDDASVPGIIQIKIDDVDVEDSAYYMDLIKKFNENPKFISNDKKNGYSKVYIKFDKAGYIQMAYDKTKYDGKETTFYIKKSVIKENIIENNKD